jgi:hypothetical protein
VTDNVSRDKDTVLIAALSGKELTPDQERVARELIACAAQSLTGPRLLAAVRACAVAVADQQVAELP